MIYLTDNILSILSVVLPIVASLCVLIVIIVNIYLKIRRRIPAKVNCWFCNEWTKVHYDNRNSFDCPKCLQYNGFDIDGGYNKIIPAQHDELLNYQPFQSQRSSNNTSNGLCRICNNNQQLKIYQLANFVPLNENRFDVEIEHFRTQLEKAYKLCKRCDSVVKQTITHQNKRLLGVKLSKLKKHGLSLLDLENSYNGIAKESKQTYLLYFVNIAIVLFTLIILVNSMQNIDLSNETLNKIFPSYVLPYILLVKKYFIFILNIFKNYFINILESDEYKSFEKEYYLRENALQIKNSLLHFIFNNHLVKSAQFQYFVQYIDSSVNSIIPTRPSLYYVCFSGLFMQVVDYLFNSKKRIIKLTQIVLWILHILIWKYNSEKGGIFASTFQITLCLLMIYTTCVTKVKEMYNIKVQTEPTENKQKYNMFLTRKLDDTPHPYVKVKKSKKPTLLKTFKHKQNNSETDTAESDCSYESIISTSTQKHSKISPNLNISSYLNKSNHVFGQPPVFGDIFNKTALSFEELSASESNDSFVTSKTQFVEKINGTITHSNNFDVDLNTSLDNLHLGSLQKTGFKPKEPKQKIFTINSDIVRPRPILSPPKLKNVNQNSWTAGGFWKHYESPNFSEGNMSRCSSQTSGFISQCNEPMYRDTKFNSLPPSLNSSTYGDCERSSLISEPAYHCNLTERHLNEQDDILDLKHNNTQRPMYSSSLSLQNFPTKFNHYTNHINSFKYMRNLSNYNKGKIGQLTANSYSGDNFHPLNECGRCKSAMEIDNNSSNKFNGVTNIFGNLPVKFHSKEHKSLFKPLNEL